MPTPVSLKEKGEGKKSGKGGYEKKERESLTHN
jgi:hypothetical protein